MALTGFLALALLATSTVDEQLHGNDGDEVGSSQTDDGLQRGELADASQLDVVAEPRIVPLEYPYQRPCEDDPGNEQENYESDLCAQWTAADAAAKSVGLTFWQNVIALISVALSFFGVCLVVWSLSIARKANEHASNAVRTASESLVLAKAEIEHRMRPKCSIVGISLPKNWIGNIRNGTDLPIIFHVENLGGSTARHVEIAIKHFRVLGQYGAVQLDQMLRIEVPPVRVDRPRHVKQMLRPSARWPTAHSIEIVGSIGFRDSRVSGDVNSRVYAENFFWADNPKDRSSTELVERE